MARRVYEYELRTEYGGSVCPWLDLKKFRNLEFMTIYDKFSSKTELGLKHEKICY